MLMLISCGNEVGVRNFTSNLASTPWAKTMRINQFPSLSNICVFDYFCHCFSIKFLKTVSGFVLGAFISRVF